MSPNLCESEASVCCEYSSVAGVHQCACCSLAVPFPPSIGLFPSSSSLSHLSCSCRLLPCTPLFTPIHAHTHPSPPTTPTRHQQFVDAGIPMLCEMGLDPGMDHLSAMRVIHEVQDAGGKITSFSSVCGGLPAPEAANNPLAYKFSWSPRGVLTAAGNSARYLKDGEVIEVKGEDLLSTATPINAIPSLALEQLPNRDSVPYVESMILMLILTSTGPCVPQLFAVLGGGCNPLTFPNTDTHAPPCPPSFPGTARSTASPMPTLCTVGRSGTPGTVS